MLIEKLSLTPGVIFLVPNGLSLWSLSINGNLSVFYGWLAHSAETTHALEQFYVGHGKKTLGTPALAAWLKTWQLQLVTLVVLIKP